MKVFNDTPASVGVRAQALMKESQKQDRGADGEKLEVEFLESQAVAA